MGLRVAHHSGSRKVFIDGGGFHTEGLLPGPVPQGGEKILGQEVNQLPVYRDGLPLTHPDLSTLDNWTASCVITIHLLIAL